MHKNDNVQIAEFNTNPTEATAIAAFTTIQSVGSSNQATKEFILRCPQFDFIAYPIRDIHCQTIQDFNDQSLYHDVFAAHVGKIDRNQIHIFIRRLDLPAIIVGNQAIVSGGWGQNLHIAISFSI